MKRRIFAVIALFALLLSGMLTACNGGGNESGASEVEGETVSLKEIFESSLVNALTLDENSEIFTLLSELEGYEIPEQKDVYGVMNTEITKLQAGGLDLSSLGTVTLDGNIYYDAESGRTSGDMLLNALGEKPKLEFTLDDSGAYITNLLGVNDKPLFIDTNSAAQEALDEQELAKIESAIKAYPEIYNHIKTTVQAVLDSDVDETCFTLASADALADGLNAQEKMILLTLTGEKAKSVSDKLITELMKNEHIKALLGDEFDKNELLSNADNIKELTLLNTINGDTTTALSLGIIADNGEISENYRINVIGINAFPVLELGVLGEDGKFAEAVKLTYSGSEDRNHHSVTIDVTEDGVSRNAVTAYIHKQTAGYLFDIKLSQDSKSHIGLKLVLENNESGGRITISDVKSTDAEGKTEKLPISFEVNYKLENEVLTAESVINATLENGVNIIAESSFVGQYQDVTLEAVTDFMPYEEFDLSSKELELALTYPKLYTFIKMYGFMS